MQHFDTFFDAYTDSQQLMELWAKEASSKTGLKWAGLFFEQIGRAKLD